MTYTQFFLDLMQPAKNQTVDVEIPEPIAAEIVDTEIIDTENASELF